MSVSRCDVLIAGAGPAGCAAALALQRQGMAVLLLDRPLSQAFRIGESATPDVAGHLAQLAMEHALDKHLPYHGNVSLWGSESPQLDHFLFRAQGHGWHLDRASFDQALLQEAITRGVIVLNQTCVDSIAPEADGWRVQVRGLGEVAAKILVDAGGRRSPLATRIGVQRRQLDQLQALACQITIAESLGGYSLVESCPYGWWYAAELPNGRAMVTLMSDRDIVKSEQLHDPLRYLRAWRSSRLMAERIPAPRHDVQVHAFPAQSGCASHAAGKNWICVGDALMGLDPLTSSGISGALSDALASVPAITGMLENRTGAVHAYVHRANHSFKRYLVERRQHYALESRWTDSPFWRRRTAAESTQRSQIAA